MPTDNAANKVVVHKADGKLGTRDLNSLVAAPADTSRSLGSDLEIFKTFCSCPPENMPPSMVRKLLNSGYSEEDLSLMGVSQQQIRRSKPVLDGDGNAYEVMKVVVEEVGTFYVLKENLKTTKFNDGTTIIGNLPAGAWVNAAAGQNPAWAYPESNPANKDKYGLLYNGYVLTGGKNACPLGWTPANNSDLMNIGSSTAEYFRAVGTDTWDFPNSGNDFSGLNLPGAGGIEITGDWVGFRIAAVLHSYQENPSTGEIMSTVVLKDNETVLQSDYPKAYGGSIRCVSISW
ncbi:fibrobacter succinogenes major paralogous domain-containing protein [Marinilongibacter aquaticus]|uniref:fibrobacter succinogenes major paralogous domain-containing protein n=1 Tax=Marinilongibacter aquaticus TaxID=2975157 RepID=UPI0021BDB631|nr:fibrobacter succinogenes major paralogous domain-containing protein [Marinilongibacter aquaticus]UBM58746.1 fibrobacter succinogenes major paralogous domain-containing protein [Marinilongibacter aquaticus]